eukprot:9652859-Ditylum_brightwellii.AAC.1
MAIWSGENRPAPFGIPNAAYWSFPASSWKRCSWMVKFAPLMSQSRISFSCSQRLSCWSSFLRAMESPPG